jgi:phenylpropionate dioxygenase-like ring-hydroxylating dioxygenase large terminal subunit
VESAVTLIPDAYTDSDFFDLEQRQVFGRNWVVAGPATQVKNTGDILVTDIGGQSVIITRDEGGDLRGFYNVCRHRGTQLCAASGAVKKHIICPYHGWGYNLRGDCVGTPLFDKGANRRMIKMHDMSHLRDFDKKEFGLFPVRVAQWGMLVFACLDDTAPSLQDVVGDLSTRLANYRLDEWEVLGERTYDIQCNWKLLVENAVEYYHLPWVHPRLAKTSRIVDHHRWQGDGMYCGICTSPVTTTDDAGWLSMKNLSGLSTVEQASGYFFGLFPNVIIFVMPSHAFIILARPVSASRTTETAWLVSHPECAKDASNKEINEVLSFWDEVNLEDVSICEKVQRGLAQNPYAGGRMCYHFEEPVHRFQNMVIDAMVGRRHIPVGSAESTAA